VKSLEEEKEFVCKDNNGEVEELKLKVMELEETIRKKDKEI
jgi:hypothetical protein